MATASPSPTPNPDATKFTLDTTLPATFNVTSADAAVGNRFAEDVFAAAGVASVFGVNDFVTVTCSPPARARSVRFGGHSRGDAVDSGYRRDELALWHRPSDPSAIWLVSPDGVERWPAGDTPAAFD